MEPLASELGLKTWSKLNWDSNRYIQQQRPMGTQCISNLNATTYQQVDWNLVIDCIPPSRSNGSQIVGVPGVQPPRLTNPITTTYRWYCSIACNPCIVRGCQKYSVHKWGVRSEVCWKSDSGRGHPIPLRVTWAACVYSTLRAARKSTYSGRFVRLSV